MPSPCGDRVDKKRQGNLFMFVRGLVFSVLLVTSAAAQDRFHKQVSFAASDAIGAAEGGAAISIVPAPLPEAPTPHRVIDKKFIVVMSALGGAESMRFTSRKLVLENEYAAGAPWVTRIEPNQHLVARYAGLYAAELAVAHEMKKPHDWLPGDRILRKFWWAYPAAMTAIHIKNGVRNIRTRGPGGCASIECAEQMQ
jgi:hypothetical protein